MIRPSNSKIYLDTCFIIAYFTLDHEFNSQAVTMLSLFQARQNTLFISPHVIFELVDQVQKDNNRKIGKKGKPPKSVGYYYGKIKPLIESLFLSKIVVLIQWQSKEFSLEALNLLDYIKQYSLGTKDAMHLTYMISNDIPYIATFDADFHTVRIIEKISN